MIKDAIKKPYFLLKHNHTLWFNAFNRGGRQLFEQHEPKLEGANQRVVSELRQKGIAFSSLDELFPGTNMLETVQSFVQTLDTDSDHTHKKSFLKPLLDPRAPIDFANPLLQIAISPTALDIANSYMRMWTRFKYDTLNVTLPVQADQKAEFSQRWHRDPQELRQVKLFIYLSDVTKDRGPFTYVAGSNYGNQYGDLFPQQPPIGVYPPEGAVEKAVDPAAMVVATGKPGTVIFCDTSGLHMGGYATGGERVMYTALFTAPSYVERPWYQHSSDWTARTAGMSAVQRFALHTD